MSPRGPERGGGHAGRRLRLVPGRGGGLACVWDEGGLHEVRSRRGKAHGRVRGRGRVRRVCARVTSLFLCPAPSQVRHRPVGDKVTEAVAPEPSLPDSQLGCRLLTRDPTPRPHFPQLMPRGVGDQDSAPGLQQMGGEVPAPGPALALQVSAS